MAREAHLLLLVGDDHPPDAGVAGRHDASEADVAAGQGLQLERDVLEDVRDVRPLLQPLDEPPGVRRASIRARWSVGRRLDQALGESREIGGRYGVERAERNVAGDDGRETPEVGTAKRADARDPELLGPRNGIDAEDARTCC